MINTIKIYIPAILALLLLAVEIAFNIFGSNIQISLWFAVALLLLQVGILYFELEKARNVRPRIDPYEIPYVDVRSIIQSSGGKTNSVTNVIFFHMRFANNPKSRVEQATARKVFAKLSYYDEAKRRLVGPIFGRWEDTEQPGARSLYTPNRDLLSVDLESSGLPRELNLVLKYPQEGEIYAFNNDSYSFSEWKNPSFLLRTNRILIHIRLSGENVDNTDYWLLIENKGDAQIIQFTKPLVLPADQDKTNWMKE